MHLVSKLLSTLFGIGYLPGSGTITSLIIFILAYFFFTPLEIITRLTILVLLTVVLWVTTEYFRAAHNYVDPPFIVSDEILGSLLITALITTELWVFIAAFVFFRIFDIFKWIGINSLQKLPQTVGIMADDILAAIYSLIIVFAVQIALIFI